MTQSGIYIRWLQDTHCNASASIKKHASRIHFYGLDVIGATPFTRVAMLIRIFIVDIDDGRSEYTAL